jgi:hypothetical protein
MTMIRRAKHMGRTFKQVDRSPDGTPDRRSGWRIVSTLVLSLLAGTAFASDPLYTFGPDGNGVGRVLSRIVPPAPGVALGDGTAAFNGGLAYVASEERFYAISNDASGHSALTSFTAAAPTAMATPRALGTGFYGGLAADGDSSTLYAVASDPVGASTLYRIDPATGVTAVAALGVGYYGGLAFDSADGDLYAIGADDFGVQRRVSRIDLDAAGGPSVTTLFDLGDSSLGFQGGLAFDASMKRFVVIGNDMFAHSSLYAFSTSGATSLLDLATPVGVGFVNAGLAFAPASVPAVPEPSSVLLLAAALPLLWLGVRRRANANPATRPSHHPEGSKP